MNLVKSHQFRSTFASVTSTGLSLTSTWLSGFSGSIAGMFFGFQCAYRSSLSQQHHSGCRVLSGLLGCILPLTIVAQALAQDDLAVQKPILTAPDQQQLFERDRNTYQAYTEARRRKILEIEKENNPTVDVKATNVEFLREPQRAKGTGGVVVSRAGVSVQADDAFVNMDSKDSNLNGNILISGINAEIAGEAGDFNLETERGTFSNSQVGIDDGGYNFLGGRIDKISEFTYKLFDARLTTCGCEPDGASWYIEADEAEATQEGYAHVYGATFKMYDIPFFYTPYIAFPVKVERASGLLQPGFGFGRQDGVVLSLPLFGVIDETSDVTVTPFVATQSRYGAGFDYRKVFSNYNQLNSHFVYSNETPRGSESRGIDFDAYKDPVTGEPRPGGLIDTNRFGARFQQTWRGQQDDIIPWGLNSDINYVSDPLLLRELLDPAMGDPLARFTTSRVALSGAFGEYVTGSVGGEYNQAMIDPQETLLQRLPTFNVGAQRSFRPFGFNPYGIKLNTQVMANSVNFSRDKGFDGWRHDISPSVAVPFHYENYFDSQLSLTNRQTFYEMSNTMDPNSGLNREFNTDRSVYLLSYNTQTAVERVYDLEPGNSLTYLTSLGSESQLYRLERVKHSITPFVNLLYIPQEQQIKNPLYDSFDVIGERKLVTYGFRTALLGRFLPPGGVGRDDIPELTPRVQDVDLFGGAASGIPDFGNARMFGNDRNISIRDGEIREVMYLAMRQSYDLAEAQNDRDKGRESLSDLYTEIGFSPTRYFSVWGGNNFNTWRATATSWDMGASFRDDRGDVFALRYQYNGPQYDINTMTFAENPNLDQVEGNIELVLTEQVRLGYYARFDSIKSDLQASRAALRFSDSCKCWAFDVGYGEQQNPDRQFFNVGLSLFGLGMIQQRFGINQQNGAAP